MKTTSNAPNRLLVIDDNESIHDDFRKIFRKRPPTTELDELAAELFGDPVEPDVSPATPSTFDLTFASQGQQGFKILSESIAKGEMFDAAFVDMRMPPGWDGVETIEHLWEADPDIQVVICTAYSDHSWDSIVSRLGSTDNLIVLKKPFDEIEIIQLATSLTEKRRRLTESKNTIARLEDSLKLAKAQVKALRHTTSIMANSIEGVLIGIDESGRISHWNTAAESKLDIPAADAIGATIGELPIRWKNSPDLNEAIMAAGLSTPQAIELSFRTTHGVTQKINASIFLTTDDAANASCMILATH